MDRVDKIGDKPAPHPAKFSDPILEVIAPHVKGCLNILDPFAGVGKVALLKQHGFTGSVTCNELEEEWTRQAWVYGADEVIVGDALLLGGRMPASFDAIVTSPVYGNRMSDHHDARDNSKRITYRHKLGRKLTRGNSGMLQWGPKYRAFHLRAWRSILECLKPGGVFVLNCSNHIRKGEVQDVTQWHVLILQAMDLVVEDWVKVDTKRMRFGENHQSRVGYESVVVFRKGS